MYVGLEELHAIELKFIAKEGLTTIFYRFNDTGALSFKESGTHSIAQSIVEIFIVLHYDTVDHQVKIMFDFFVDIIDTHHLVFVFDTRIPLLGQNFQGMIGATLVWDVHR